MGSVATGQTYQSIGGTRLLIQIMDLRQRTKECRIRVVESEVEGILGIEVWLPCGDIHKHYKPLTPTWEV